MLLLMLLCNAVQWVFAQLLQCLAHAPVSLPLSLSPSLPLSLSSPLSSPLPTLPVQQNDTCILNICMFKKVLLLGASTGANSIDCRFVHSTGLNLVMVVPSSPNCFRGLETVVSSSRIPLTITPGDVTIAVSWCSVNVVLSWIGRMILGPCARVEELYASSCIHVVCRRVHEPFTPPCMVHVTLVRGFSQIMLVTEVIRQRGWLQGARDC
jgi:hypothetical protein